jgi:hypothetical protein
VAGLANENNRNIYINKALVDINGDIVGYNVTEDSTTHNVSAEYLRNNFNRLEIACFQWRNDVSVFLDRNGNEYSKELHPDFVVNSDGSGSIHDQVTLPSSDITSIVDATQSSSNRHKYSILMPDGNQAYLTEGTRITHITVIAGKGRKREIDVVDLLLDKYGGLEHRWVKKKGIGYLDYLGESNKAELHWYEEPTVGQVEFKVKTNYGEWFINE